MHGNDGHQGRGLIQMQMQQQGGEKFQDQASRPEKERGNEGDMEPGYGLEVV